MQILVKTISGKHIIIEIEATSTILQLKEQIFKKEGIPVERFNLLTETKFLYDKDKISDYNLKNGYTVNIHIKLNS